MIYHAYYTVSEVRVKDVDIPFEAMSDMRKVYDHAILEIAEDPKAGRVVERGDLVQPEAHISLNALERDGVFFEF